MRRDDSPDIPIFRLIEVGFLARRYAELRLVLLKTKLRRGGRRLALAMLVALAAVFCFLLSLGTGAAAVVVGLHAAGFTLASALALTGLGALMLTGAMWLVTRSLCRGAFKL